MSKIKQISGDEGLLYTLAPIRAGQMRDLMTRRAKNGTSATDGFMDDNIATVVYCLNNGGTTITTEQVEAMEYPLYKQLLDAANELSGFSEKKEGEAQAT